MVDCVGVRNEKIEKLKMFYVRRRRVRTAMETKKLGSERKNVTANKYSWMGQNIHN